MRFLYVIDPIERWNVTKDTTFVFMAESQSRSHTNYACTIQDLMVDQGKVYVSCAPIEVTPTQGHHWKYGTPEVVPAETFDAVFMRKDPPFDIDFYFSTHILSLIDEKKTFVFNRASGLREANEKLYILNFPDLMPATFVSADPGQLLAFCDKVGGDMVVKPLDGSGGMGIFRVTRGDLNTHSILETMTREGRRTIMAQRFLPASRDGDMRLIYLDGEALGAMKRVPKSDDLRGNIHVGGTCVKADIGPREREICAKLTPAMRDLGLWFAGLDVIGGHLTEVNVTSPTGIQEINRLYGTKLETHVIDFVESRCRDLKRA